MKLKDEGEEGEEGNKDDVLDEKEFAFDARLQKYNSDQQRSARV